MDSFYYHYLFFLRQCRHTVHMVLGLCNIKPTSFRLIYADNCCLHPTCRDCESLPGCSSLCWAFHLCCSSLCLNSHHGWERQGPEGMDSQFHHFRLRHHLSVACCPSCYIHRDSQELKTRHLIQCFVPLLHMLLLREFFWAVPLF